VKFHRIRTQSRRVPPNREPPLRVSLSSLPLAGSDFWYLFPLSIGSVLSTLPCFSPAVPTPHSTSIARVITWYTQYIRPSSPEPPILGLGYPHQELYGRYRYSGSPTPSSPVFDHLVLFRTFLTAIPLIHHSYQHGESDRFFHLEVCAACLNPFTITRGLTPPSIQPGPQGIEWPVEPGRVRRTISDLSVPGTHDIGQSSSGGGRGASGPLGLVTIRDRCARAFRKTELNSHGRDLLEQNTAAPTGKQPGHYPSDQLIIHIIPPRRLLPNPVIHARNVLPEFEHPPP